MDKHDRSVAAYSEALGLWRGEPWAELAESPAVTAARARLHELHAVAVEELQAARLAAGNSAEAVASLTGAVTEAAVSGAPMGAAGARALPQRAGAR